MSKFATINGYDDTYYHDTYEEAVTHAEDSATDHGHAVSVFKKVAIVTAVKTVETKITEVK